MRFILFVLFFSVYNISSYGVVYFTFYDYCKNKKNESNESERTINILLSIAGTENCNDADNILSNLEFIDLSHKNLVDISSLYGLSRLKKIDLSHNKISDISSLTGPYNLESINLENNEVKFLDDIFNLSVKEVNLSHNFIEEININFGFQDIETLILSHNRIKNIQYIRPDLKISHFDISYNNITSIKEIEKLDHLVKFNFHNNPITDLMVLRSLISSLEEVSFDLSAGNQNLLDKIGYVYKKTNKLENSIIEIKKVKDFFNLIDIYEQTLYPNEEECAVINSLIDKYGYLRLIDEVDHRVANNNN